jgi:hypothetical protein
MFHAPGSGSSQNPSERTQSGHVAPPGCPAPWTPLSPSACHFISPQYMRGHRFAAQGAHRDQHGQARQLLSAVPMGMHGQHAGGTPFGTSPPQHSSFLAAHLQKMIGSVRGSPAGAQAPHHSSQMVQMPFASPPLSESSSRIGMQQSPCMHSRPSPQDPAVPSNPQPIPGAMHETAPGARRIPSQRACLALSNAS